MTDDASAAHALQDDTGADVDGAAVEDEALASHEINQKVLDIVEVLASDVDDLSVSQAELRARIDEIGQQAAVVDPQFSDTLRPWSRGPRTEMDWDRLVDWVDEIAFVHAVAELPPCWPAHERLVLELEAARSAWYEAAAIHAKQPTNALWNWYAYTWHPLRRLLSDWTVCRTAHQADAMAAVTDRHYLPCDLFTAPAAVDQPCTEPDQ